MEILHPICAGIDVHQASVTVCLRCCQDKGNVHLESRKFDTTTKGLLTLAEWLKESHCPIAGMESTGVYWKPVYHILSTQMEIVVGNARDIRARPGKKTDKSDAKWIAELLAHGMIPPSFVPSPEISALRDLTRARVQRIQTRTAAKNRIHKLLEDTNIKLSSVVSDLLGKSGRSMLEALISGERNAQSLARLAKGRLKPKIAQLELALEGRFTDHHAKLIQLELEQIDLCNKQIEAIEQEIDVLLLPLSSALGKCRKRLNICNRFPAFPRNRRRLFCQKLDQICPVLKRLVAWRVGLKSVLETMKAQVNTIAARADKATNTLNVPWYNLLGQ